MSRTYILDDKNQPVLCGDTRSWRWMEENPVRKIVGLTRFPDGSRVSTVFLCMDHGWSDNLPPVLWETMIFGGDHDEFQERYSSYEEAIKGHLAAIDLVRSPAVRA